MQIITTHTGTDFDALASMVAAKKLYPGARICFPGSLSREVKQFMSLYGDIVQNVKTEDIDLDKITRLILVDTRWINRIGIFRQLIGKKEVEIHLYDHHPPHPGDIEGDVGICKEVGATVSILTELIRKREIPISPAEATLFGLGIYEDTGSLSFTSTTPLDLEMAGWLLSRGASLELISSFLNRGLTKKQTLLFSDFLEKAQTRIINGIEVVVVTTEVDEFIGGLSLPLHKFIDFKNLKVVFALIKTRDKIHLIARSRIPSVNVAEILSVFGGGGHNFAASAVIKEKDLKEVEGQLYQILEERVEPETMIKEVMSTPVITTVPQTSVREAKDMFKKYGIGVLPIMEKGNLMGLISREEVDRLSLHNPEKIPLKGHFSPKFASVSPLVSVRKAQEIMREEEVRRILVMEKNKLVGVITGSDLLDFFHREKKDLNTANKRRNLTRLLEEKVPRRILYLLRQAGKIAQEMGYKVFIVGGFVRDLLLGIDNLDIDLVVEGEGIVFAAKFAERTGGKLLKKHREFGTATLIFPEDFKLDIATSRREFYPEPAVLPQVEPASLYEDLWRRDFTLNAMAIDLSPSSSGRLIDFFGGERDIRERKVRVLHQNSFIEDPTRVFRAIRFEQRYGFTIEKKTEELIKEVLKKGIFHQLSKQRIKDEMIQILEEDKPEKAIYRMQELGVLEAIHPRMHLTPQREKILDSLVDVFARFEIFSEESIKKWLIRFLVLLEGLNEEELKKFCSEYKFTREERNSIMEARLKAEKVINGLKVSGSLSPSFIYYFLQPFSRETLLFAMAKAKEELVEKRILLYLSRLRNVEAEIDGDDLKRMGYKPSPRFKEILEAVKRARLDGKVRTKEEEIKYVRENFPSEVEE